MDLSDLNVLRVALRVAIRDVRDHVADGDVPPHEIQRLLVAAQAALDHLDSEADDLDTP